MKKSNIIIAACMIITITCGCTNPFVGNAKEQVKDVKLIEVQNPDYTFTYKTEDGNIIFNNKRNQYGKRNNRSILRKWQR